MNSYAVKDEVYITFFLKSLCYRVYSSVITGIICAVFTGSSQISFLVSIADFCVKICSYYCYELAWNKLVTKRKQQDGPNTVNVRMP